MKDNSKRADSRRNFIKKAGQIALGSTLAGCATIGQDSKAGRGDKAPKPGLPLVIGGPGEQDPHPPDSEFKGKRRLPGFVPNTTEVDCEYLFLEEALYREDGTKDIFHAFLSPQSPTAGSMPFDEPQTNDPANWHAFNAWILGVPFVNRGTEFDSVIFRIAQKARNYNAALYWMRRLHFHETYYHRGDSVKPPVKPSPVPPPRNPKGDKDMNVPADQWGLPHFKAWAKKAQGDWKDAVKDLNQALKAASHPPFKHIWVDMIQVNDYIVSMRVVGRADDIGHREIGGSSSSHIYVSSPFASG